MSTSVTVFRKSLVSHNLLPSSYNVTVWSYSSPIKTYLPSVDIAIEEIPEPTVFVFLGLVVSLNQREIELPYTADIFLESPEIAT